MPKNAVSRNEFIRRICKRTGIPMADVESVLVTAIDEIASALADGQNVVVNNFGRFEARPRGRRVRRHPGSGTPIEVEPSMAAGFVPAIKFREEVNRLYLARSENVENPPEKAVP